MAKILVVDDELSIRKAIALSLKNEGHEVFAADGREKAQEIILQNDLDLMVVDLFVPTEADGMAILKLCKEQRPAALVMMITAHGSIDRAVQAIKAGADDFLAKGFAMQELIFRLQRLLDQKELQEENRQLAASYRRLRQEIEGRYRFGEIIGSSKAMRDLLNLLARVVDDRDATVLLQGESGTGKELLARAIHYNGPRQDKPFVVVNCAAIPENLLESELFGYDRGAFTGALKDKPGKFEMADGGTIFLDEIGELSPKMQVELLRFLQDHTFERLGGNRPITVDVRIIAATNKRLEEEMAGGRFREDLFYRLNVIPIEVPPLRQRQDDIAILLTHFATQMRQEKGREIRFSQAALTLLENYAWPGNVRELENLVQRLAVTVPHATILPTDLPATFRNTVEREAADAGFGQESLEEARATFEKAFLLRYLEKHHWNITAVAAAIGERRDTLSRKIKRLGLKSE